MTLLLSPAEVSALWLSLKVALGSVIIGIIPAVGLAWLLARGQFWGKTLLEAFIFLPMVLPPVVIGYLLLWIFGAQSAVGQWLASWGLSISFHWTGAVVAAWVMSLPLFIQPIRLALQQIDPRLEQAARTLGASRLEVFWRITLPLCRPAIIAGAVLAFGRSLGEFGATISFVGNIEGQTRTIALAIYAAMQQPDGETMAIRLMLLSIGISLLALWWSQHLTRKHHARLEQMR